MSKSKKRTVLTRFTLLALAAVALSAMPPRVAQAAAGDPIQESSGTSTLTVPAAGAQTPQALASVNLATGAGHATLPLRLENARGDAQPSLALEYNSNNGVGFAGLGWTLALPSIVRKGASGLPRFYDAAVSNPSAIGQDPYADEYEVDGEPLIAICTVKASTCSQAPNETFPPSVLPAGTSYWTYFRRQIDDGVRYFFSPDGQTWLTQTKAGHEVQYGAPLDGAFSTGAEYPDARTVTAVAGTSNAVFRWNIVRDSDAAQNTVYYTWTNNSSLESSEATLLYLSDIYDTSYAHHVHVTWQVNQVFSTNLGVIPPPTYRPVPFASVQGIDVTSASFGSSTRNQVRRYHFQYQFNSLQTRLLLTEADLEGTCNQSNGNPYTENGNGLLPAPSLTHCPQLPLAQYQYSPDANVTSNLQPIVLNTTANVFPSPFNGDQTALLPFEFVDMAGDAFADLVWYDGSSSHLNVVPVGSGNFPESFSSSNPSNLTATYTSLAPGSPFVVHGDWQAHGTVDWLYMTPHTNEFYSPVGQALVGTSTSSNNVIFALGNPPAAGTPQGAYPVDIDGDGLVDMALNPPVSGNGILQTNLTARPHGGMRVAFHSALAVGPSSQNALFNSASSQYGAGAFRVMTDMTGDGLPDVVFVYQDSSGKAWFSTFVNRGNGWFGDDSGNPIAYQAAGIGADAPLAQSIVRFGDLNGDGLPDYIVVTLHSVQVCLRIGPADAQGWKCATVPPASGFALPNNLSLLGAAIADVEGTGIARAIVFGGATSEAIAMVGDGPTGSPRAASESAHAGYRPRRRRHQSFVSGGRREDRGRCPSIGGGADGDLGRQQGHHDELDAHRNQRERHPDVPASLVRIHLRLRESGLRQSRGYPRWLWQRDRDSDRPVG